MTDIFTKKSRWFDFANEHNKKVNASAVSLNGSESYTFAAKHIAAGKPIPTTTRLDIKRAKGVSNHFKGLREYYEFGKEVNGWIKRVAEECRAFAVENSLDGDILISNLIKLTDKSVRGTDAYRVDISSSK
ncbi:hypothetical protein [Oryzomonas rubra]|uniref:Uncharacterized protein n=1 Tax=Oryzomonas rubra TaxID=2509454 RepID=A0A5A9XPN6_9BACT|nr:hypothetical protein [Oryzomonas rubra]KAA0894208.1 hypothetical protein ET418_04435 [Oryzomonas rubra]